MFSMIYNAPIIDRTLEPRVTQSLACAPAGRADVATDSVLWSTVSRPLSDANQANELHGYFSMEPQEVASADHSNQQYSVTAVTTSSGTIAERYAYSAYGEPTILDASGSAIGSSAINNRYSYTGREWDATVGLHHFRARWMSPKSGRFLGRDPIDYEGSEWNLYEFLESDALGETDSSGLAVDSITGAIQQCMKKATPALQIECLELFISQGIDKNGVLKQMVNKIKYGKPRPPRPNRRQNRRGTNCTEAQHAYYHGMVTLACKTNAYSCGQNGAKTDLCPKELLARSALAGGCATARFTYQRMCFPRSHPEWQEHENKRAEAAKTASICLAKAKLRESDPCCAGK